MSRVARARAVPRYAELQVTSNFSFLRGGSHAYELVERAQQLDLDAIAVADGNTLAGVVRAHIAARKVGLRVIAGARLDLCDAPSLLCCPRIVPPMVASRACYRSARGGLKRAIVSFISKMLQRMPRGRFSSHLRPRRGAGAKPLSRLRSSPRHHRSLLFPVPPRPGRTR